MNQDFSMGDFPQDVPQPPPDVLPEIQEVPHHLEVLPDSREVLVFGDPEGMKQYNHLQGDNPYGFKGTCGLVSCQDILRQFGVEVSEGDVVHFAVDHKLCNVTDDPSNSGGTTVEDQAKILGDFNVPAQSKSGGSLEELAQNIEEGHGVIAEVNSATLWDQPSFFNLGLPDHAIVVTGVARDPETGEIRGFYINDSGVPPAGHSGLFIDAQKFNTAWNGCFGGPGWSVVTDVVRA